MNLKAISKSKGKNAGMQGCKLSFKKLTVYAVAESIRKGLAEVKLIEEEKLEPKTLKELLREL